MKAVDAVPVAGLAVALCGLAPRESALRDWAWFELGPRALREAVGGLARALRRSGGSPIQDALSVLALSAFVGERLPERRSASGAKVVVAQAQRPPSRQAK